MAPSTKCLPHMLEDLSLDPQRTHTHTSEPGMGVRICDPSTRQAQTVDQIAHWA